MCKKKKYQANWESLNKAPVPEWFNEAKIGLYVFWIPYSVPAYDPEFGYAEWYGFCNCNQDFHEKNYGKDFIYEDFVDMWKAELWNPKEWAELFSESGAKYVVVVAKYHDGFCLFPTIHESRTINKNKLNSIDRGPKRDIVGELFDAGNAKNLKMGLYTTVYEWWHPLWVNPDTRERYVDEMFHPHFKEMVNNYKPWFVFTDGAWEADDKTFKSEELVAWLLNDSPVKDYVAFNDRWGNDRKGKNGIVFNTEFGGGEGYKNRAWQEDRSFGPSYGYNRKLKITDYDTPNELIRMILQVVSRGGNILLGVGPKADGTIPSIYQERMKQMGDWLRVNGDAIYGTQSWTKTEQSRLINITKTEKNIDNDWGLAAPNPAISKIKFNTKWQGWIKPSKSKEYTFYITTLGESKLFLNDNLLIARTGANASNKYIPDTVKIRLDENKSYKFRLEYYRHQNSHNVKSSEAKLHWSFSGSKKEIVPANVFYLDQDLKTNGLQADYSSVMADVYYTKKDNSLYAICPKWPGSELILEAVVPSRNANIRILGIDEKLKWEVKNNNLHIKVPALTIDKLPC